MANEAVSVLEVLGTEGGEAAVEGAYQDSQILSVSISPNGYRPVLWVGLLLLQSSFHIFHVTVFGLLLFSVDGPRLMTLIEVFISNLSIQM